MSLKETRARMDYQTLTEAEVEMALELSETIARAGEQAGATEFQLMIAAVTVVMGMINQQDDPNERGVMVQEVFELMWEAAGLPRT